MGRWKRRNPQRPREERIRLTALGRELILEIARNRSWSPIWDFDDPYYVECIVVPGNPGLDVGLNMCCTEGGLAWWAEPYGGDGAEWFEADEAAGREAFARSIDDWLKARAA